MKNTHWCILWLLSIFVCQMEKISLTARLKPRIREGHRTIMIQRWLKGKKRPSHGLKHWRDVGQQL